MFDPDIFDRPLMPPIFLGEDTKPWWHPEPTFTVYSAICWSTRLTYIGCTSATLETRRRWHFGATTKRNTKLSPFHQAIKDHGLENFMFQVIAEVPDLNVARELERLFIKLDNTIWPNGYNVHRGGEGGPTGPKRKHSEEGKEAHRKAAFSQHADPIKKASHVAGIRNASEKYRQLVVGTRWANNGLIGKRLKPNVQLPDGFVWGRRPR